MNKVPVLVIYTDDVAAHSFIPARFPQLRISVTDSEAESERNAREADILFIACPYRREMIVNAPRLKWLHLGGTGIDRLRPLDELDPQLIITHTPGLSVKTMADYVVCVILMLVWDFPRIFRNQAARRWERWTVERVEGKTLALLGLGNVGRAVAHEVRALGLRVVGIRRSAGPVPGVERVVGPERLHEVLAEADFVVVAVPLTSATAGIIAEAEFKVMKRTAFLVNIARGGVVEEEALVIALRARQIAGAVLDVYEREPLPAGHPLWGLENVILSPHISSLDKDYRPRAAELFCANLERYLARQPLLNVIDRLSEY